MYADKHFLRVHHKNIDYVRQVLTSNERQTKQGKQGSNNHNAQYSFLLISYPLNLDGHQAANYDLLSRPMVIFVYKIIRQHISGVPQSLYIFMHWPFQQLS